jgi:hypothetical protein
VFRLLRARKAVRMAMPPAAAMELTELAPVALTKEEEAAVAAADLVALFRFGAIQG